MFFHGVFPVLIYDNLTTAVQKVYLGKKRDLQEAYNKFVAVLVLDELGYVPFSKEGSELLFQVLAERHGKRPVIITTNMGFGDWTQVFGDPNLTAALLDRVTHKAHIVSCNWESYRLKETLKKKR